MIYRNIRLGNMYYNFPYSGNMLNIRSHEFYIAQYYLMHGGICSANVLSNLINQMAITSN